MNTDDISRQVEFDHEETTKKFTFFEEKLDQSLLLSTNHISHLEVAVADLATGIEKMNSNLSGLLQKIIDKF